MISYALYTTLLLGMFYYFSSCLLTGLSPYPLPPIYIFVYLTLTDFWPGSRNDLLSEDLLLENKYRESFKKKKPAKRKRLSKPSKKDYESGTYHYIAFVPVDGQVWELDGLESKPLCLGKFISTPAPRPFFLSSIFNFKKKFSYSFYERGTCNSLLTHRFTDQENIQRRHQIPG